MSLLRILPESTSIDKEVYRLPAHKKIDGDPEMSVQALYASTDQKFASGIWESEPGKWHIHYTEDEYCYILFGVSIVTDTQTGSSFTVKTHDQFIIPAGFQGTWEVVETTKKIYVLYEKS